MSKSLREYWVVCLFLAVMLLGSMAVVGAADTLRKGGILRVAIAGEPPTLDTHWTTANAVGLISWHINEGLFALDEKYAPVPMLLDDYRIEDGGKRYVFELRKGVLFHNGKELSAEDVIASLNRWGRIAAVGKTLYENISSIAAPDKYTVVLQLVKPSGTVPVMLAIPNPMAAIYPKEVIEEAGEGKITTFVGTGPYRFVEHRPDRYIKLKRFEDYIGRSEPASGASGMKHAYVDEILFIPVPDVAVRIAGVETGEYDYAEQITQDSYGRLKDRSDIDTLIVKPWWWPMAVLNKDRGPFTDKRVRQAFLAALDMEPIMAAAFGSKEFYRLDPGCLFKEQIWYTDAGGENYNQANLEKARQLLKEAGYKGEPLRWMTTTEIPWVYTTALVASKQLEKVGFNIELEVMDWATAIDRRSRVETWEIYGTANTFTVDPAVWPSIYPAPPVNWKGEEKDKVIERLNTEITFEARYAAWEELQRLFYEDVPLVKFGDFFDLSIKSPRLNGFEPRPPIPYFWNVWLSK